MLGVTSIARGPQCWISISYQWQTPVTSSALRSAVLLVKSGSVSGDGQDTFANTILQLLSTTLSVVLKRPQALVLRDKDLLGCIVHKCQT